MSKARPVLLIDDHDEYRESVNAAFARKPYEIREATSPEEGLRMLDSDPALRVVLLDLEFAGKKSAGIPVLEHAQRHPGRYRVIVLTGHEELLGPELASAYELFNYLPKSEQSSALVFSVEQAFKDIEREQLVRKNKYLLEVQQRIGAGSRLEATLDFVCEAVCSTVGAYNCHIRVYDFEHGDFRLAGFSGLDDSLRELFVSPRIKGDLFSGQVVQTKLEETYGSLQKLPSFSAFARSTIAGRAVTPAQRRYLESVESAFIVPIDTELFQPGVDAVLNVSSDVVDFFDANRQAMVKEFVTQAGLAITRSWLQAKREEVQRDNAAISEMLAEISDELRSARPLDRIYEIVTGRIAKIVNPEIVSIFLYDEATRKLQNVAELRGDSLVIAPGEAYESGQSLTGWVYKNNRSIQQPEWGKHPVRVTPTEDERFDLANLHDYLKSIPSDRIEHYLGVPIRIGGKARGVLRAVNKRSKYYDMASAATNPNCLLDRGFSNDCLNAMEIAASHLGVAIRNAELFLDKHRQIEMMRTLGGFGNVIASAADVRDVLRLTVQRMAEVMDAEFCLLFLKSGDGQLVVLEESHGLPASFSEGKSYELGERVTGTVAQTGVAQLVSSTDDAGAGKYDDEIVRILAGLYGQPTRLPSYMVVPILAPPDTILGVMKVINKAGRRDYTQQDLEWFKTFGSYVGLAIDNARAAIRERNTALSNLVRAVAHEINNTSGLIPLTVTGLREQLGAAAESGSIKRRLALIERVAEAATEFATEIASFGAGRSGTTVAMDVNEVVEAAIEDLQTLAKYQNSESFRIEVSTSAKPLTCQIFKLPFVQIVRNILINAAQALENSGRSGVIRVSTQAGPGRVPSEAVLRFEDNGPGIRPDYLARVFEPDFTTKAAGNGLGLWLVRTQLEQIGGSITVNSEHGHGARFTIRLPLAATGGVA